MFARGGVLPAGTGATEDVPGFLSRDCTSGLTAAADGSHTSGCMIALMLGDQDAQRIAIPGGESADQLHCTLFYLGPDATAWGPEQRADLVQCLTSYVNGMGPVPGNIFGVAHWNGDGEKPSWVWSVGDDPERDSPGLQLVHTTAMMALEDMNTDQPDLAPQHTPWVAHICAQYTDDITMLPDMEKRLGPVTFDRIRVSFGDDDTDIPLAGSADAVTAAASPKSVLRRQVNATELAAMVDFVAHQAGWRTAVDAALHDWASVTSAWRTEIRHQLLRDSTAAGLADLSVSTARGANLLYARMQDAAQKAGDAQQREAEQQGVTVGPWDLGAEGLTAALSGRRLLRNVADATSDLLGTRLVQSARQKARALFGAYDGIRLASEVDAALQGLSDAWTREQLGAAVTAAQAAGRTAVLEAAPRATYYSSEILDTNTCGPCRRIDGKTFSSLADAVAAYPAGLYEDCQGGDRCRGMVYAVWDQGLTAAADTEEDTVVAQDLGGKPSEGTRKDKRLHENRQHAAVQCPDGWVSDPDSDGCVPADWSPGDAAPACPPGMVRDPDGDGCVMQAAAGVQQLAAQPDGAVIPDGAKTASWEGVLALEGVRTGDGREFAPDALTWADPITPGDVTLRWNRVDSHGGEARTEAVNVGRIDRIWRDGSKIMGAGVFNLSTADGQQAHQMVADGFLRGVSIDADSIGDAQIEYVWPEAEEDGEELDLFDMLFGGGPEAMIFHGGRIRAATLCDIPAFAEAYVALTDDAGAVVAGGAMNPEDWAAAQQEQRALTAAAHLAAIKARPDWTPPPADWFADPGLSLPTPITVDGDRVYGHAALKDSPHIGFSGKQVLVPHEAHHDHFMTGALETAEGTTVSVGQITVHTGHAGLSATRQAAAEHYDHTGYAVADVCVGNDAHGIWVAGAIRPQADPLAVMELRASGQVSGDWRSIGGRLRLVGLLGVNVGGFGVPKPAAMTASGQVTALVAAGMPTMAPGLSRSEREQLALRREMDALARRFEQE